MLMYVWIGEIPGPAFLKEHLLLRCHLKGRWSCRILGTLVKYLKYEDEKRFASGKVKCLDSQRCSLFQIPLYCFYGYHLVCCDFGAARDKAMGTLQVTMSSCYLKPQRFELFGNAAGNFIFNASSN